MTARLRRGGGLLGAFALGVAIAGVLPVVAYFVPASVILAALVALVLAAAVGRGRWWR